MTTKEEYFRKCAQGRIRSYLRDAQTRLTSCSESGLKVIHSFKTLLEEHHYYSTYFDRSAVSCSDRICHPSGSFDCEGKYDQSACRKNHAINNPYDNAESRILFSTWNLDHVVERSVFLSELSKKLHQNHNCIKCNKDVRR